MEKYYIDGQATDNIIRRMRMARWIPKTTNTHTHTQYVIIIIFYPITVT